MNELYQDISQFSGLKLRNLPIGSQSNAEEIQLLNEQSASRQHDIQASKAAKSKSATKRKTDDLAVVDDSKKKEKKVKKIKS